MQPAPAHSEPFSNTFDLVAEVAHRNPQKPAIVQGDTVWTYSQLLSQAEAYAAWLLGEGAQHGAVIALHLDRSPNLVAMMLAAWRCGCAYLPLDTESPPARLKTMLEQARMPLVMTTRHYADRFEFCPNVVRYLEAVPQLKLDAYIPTQDVAFVIFTSGSTGTPKGVCVRHDSVQRLVRDTDYIEVQQNDRIAWTSTPAFDAATFEIWGPLCNGATCIILEKDQLLQPDALRAALQHHQVTVLFLTTALFQLMASTAPALFASLRVVLFGGEACDPDLVRRVVTSGKPRHLLHMYGPTETTTYATWHEVTEVQEGALRLPIGRPLRGWHFYVLDAQLRPVPIGMPGELFIGGAGVAAGYLYDDATTADKFLPDPAGGRMYRSGDLVLQRANGTLEFLGRLDGQVKLRGFRIELGEIESVLRQHVAVQDAAVVMRGTSSADQHLSAYIVPKPGLLVTQEVMLAWLRKRLPSYMLPRTVSLLSSIPLTTNGKVDRIRLPEPPQPQSAPETWTSDPDARPFADLWRELLGAPPASPQENFFDAGGHSLLALRLSVMTQETLGVQLPLPRIIELATFGAMAEEIARPQAAAPASGGVGEVVVPVRASGTRLPLFCCPPAGGVGFMYYPLASLLGDDQPLYVLHDPALDLEREPSNTVEALASQLIAGIRSVQPKGPYQLCGWSSGGTLAFEMARQLTEAGERVRNLVLFDAHAVFSNTAAGRGWGSRLNRLFRYAFIGLSLLPATWRFLLDGFGLIAISTRNRGGFMEGVKSRYAAYMLKRSGAVVEASRSDVLKGLELPTVRRVFYLYYIHEQMNLRYAPKPYSGRIHLLRATEVNRLIPTHALRDLGWGALAHGGVEVRDVPGNHSEVLGRSINETAAHLRDILKSD